MTTTITGPNIKNALKEGRKKAQDLASLYKQYGNKCFILSSEESDGDLDACKAFVQGLNEHKIVKTLSKCVFTANDDVMIGLICLSSEDKSLTIEEWQKLFIDEFTYLTMTKVDESMGVIMFNPSDFTTVSEIFPFKLKDELIQYGIRELKKKGLIATSKDDSDSDDDVDYAAEMGIEW